MIRITGGEFRSRKLITPDNNLITKPTMDRVREGIFSALQRYIHVDKVLDLYAGSGSYVFEALSRGVKEAVSVDKDNESIKAIKENARILGVSDRIRIIKSDVITFLKENNEAFDIIFVDPPYKDYDYQTLVSLVIENNILKENGILVLESEDDLALDENNWKECRKYKYGLAKIYMLRK